MNKKTKKHANYLKVANFRLAIDDLKAIDKKGKGKNSSEKLRYLIHKFKNEKTNVLKRRKAYKQIKNSNVEELDKTFNEIYNIWRDLEKNEFLMETSLKKDTKKMIKLQARGEIESIAYYEEIKKFGWFIQNITFEWDNTFFTNCTISFAKDFHIIEVPLTKDGEDIIIKEKNNVVQDNISEIDWISLEEEDIFSCLYEELQNKFFYNPQDEYTTNYYSKKYSNGDIYKAIEYGDIVIAEMEYFEKRDITLLTYVYGLIDE